MCHAVRPRHGGPAGRRRIEDVHTAWQEDPDGDVHARMGVWNLGSAAILTTSASGIRLLRTARQTRQDVEPVVALSVQQLADSRHHQLSVR